MLRLGSRVSEKWSVYGARQVCLPKGDRRVRVLCVGCGSAELWHFQDLAMSAESPQGEGPPRPRGLEPERGARAEWRGAEELLARPCHCLAGLEGARLQPRPGSASGAGTGGDGGCAEGAEGHAAAPLLGAGGPAWARRPGLSEPSPHTPYESALSLCVSSPLPLSPSLRGRSRSSSKASRSAGTWSRGRKRGGGVPHTVLSIELFRRV